MEDQQIKNILFYFMIIIIIGLSFYLIYHIRTESFQCMSNPWSYGVKSISSSNNQELSCSCSCTFLKPGQSLFITKDNSTIIDNFIFAKGGVEK
jgi:uncharacterized protein with PQ loop repeat